MTTPRKKMRRILASDQVCAAAGAYDALSAKLVEAAGFAVVNTTGLSISASFLGKPDAGYLTMTDNLAIVRNVVEAVDIPVISDVDTGYGNAVNVFHTVRQFEKCGAAGISVEDQVEPKRCPASVTNAVPIVSVEEMTGKIKAAVDARIDPDFLIVARTDARGNEAVERGQRYAEAGADMIKPTSKAFNSLALLLEFQKQMPIGVWISMVTWLGEKLTLADLAGTKCKVASFALVPVMVAAKAIRDALQDIRNTGSIRDVAGKMFTIEELANLMGMPAVLALEEKYLPVER